VYLSNPDAQGSMSLVRVDLLRHTSTILGTYTGAYRDAFWLSGGQRIMVFTQPIWDDTQQRIVAPAQAHLFTSMRWEP
jgi:hypothetical protein